MTDPQPIDDGPDPLIGTTLDGRYRIDALLGAGAMGSVYRGVHVQLRKNVAIKVLHREMTLLPEVVARFEREAVAAARVEHPNIAKAMDFGKMGDGAYYLALEYVEGQSLREAIRRSGAMTAGRAMHVARQMADALAAAHSEGIVHRDLKPDNVMLVGRDDDRDFVKVLDFGIAKVTADDFRDQPALTQAGSVFGTPEYMAPEQARGRTVDARADLYAVGIILYEMLVGRTPFAHDDLVVVMTRQMTDEPPALPATVDPRLAGLVMRLLAKDPTARVQTAVELVRELDDLDGSGRDDAAVSPVAPSVVSVGAESVSPTSRTVLSSADPAVGSPPSPPAAVVGPPPPAASSGAERGAVLLTAPARTLVVARDVSKAGADFLKHTVDVGGRVVPVWWVVAGGAGALAFIFLVSAVIAVAASADDSAAAGEGGGRTAKVLQSEDAHAKLVERAKKGDEEAVRMLEARPENALSAEDWYAIGRGRKKSRDLIRALEAYSRAAALNEALSKDEELVADVRQMADHARAGPEALRLAARLGPRGADILFDVWRSTKNRRQKKLAWELLERRSVRESATPALLVAIDLRTARRCGDYKKLMSRAIDHADSRSSRKLAALTHRRGCGFLGLGDCFSCLRTDRKLTEALKASKSRPAPAFGRPSVSPAASR